MESDSSFVPSDASSEEEEEEASSGEDVEDEEASRSQSSTRASARTDGGKATQHRRSPRVAESAERERRREKEGGREGEAVGSRNDRSGKTAGSDVPNKRGVRAREREGEEKTERARLEQKTGRGGQRLRALPSTSARAARIEEEDAAFYSGESLSDDDNSASGCAQDPSSARISQKDPSSARTSQKDASSARTSQKDASSARTSRRGTPTASFAEATPSSASVRVTRAEDAPLSSKRCCPAQSKLQCGHSGSASASQLGAVGGNRPRRIMMSDDEDDEDGVSAPGVAGATLASDAPEEYAACGRDVSSGDDEDAKRRRGRLRRGAGELSPASAVKAATAKWRQSRSEAGPSSARLAASQSRASSHESDPSSGRRNDEVSDVRHQDDDSHRSDSEEPSSEDNRADLEGEPGADAITGNALREPHVVWRSPDSSSVMRLNISTLRKIAIHSGEWKQPPHFRAPMEEKLRKQIQRKFGDKALRLPATTAGAADEVFMQHLEQYQARLLSRIHNLFCCPICLLWLRLDSALEAQRCDAAGMLDSNVDARFGGNAAEEEEVEEVLEAAAAAWGGENEANRQLREARRRRLARNAKAKSANAQSSMEEEEEELCEALLNVPFEPLTVLYRSTPVRKWERENGYAFRPEAAAAQCTMRTIAELRAHLLEDHCLPAPALKGTSIRERLNQYRLRQADSLVMRWVHAHPSHYGTSSNATKQYWTEAARQLMTSHAALYCSLYDECEEDASRTTGGRSSASYAPLFESKMSDLRPSLLAWARLGFGDFTGDDASAEDGDDIYDFIARESEEDESDSREASENYCSDSGDSGDEEEGESSEEKMDDEEAAAAAAEERARHRREEKAMAMAGGKVKGIVHSDDGGKVVTPTVKRRLRKISPTDDSSLGTGVRTGTTRSATEREAEGDAHDMSSEEEGADEAVEFMDEPDALDAAEAALRRKRREEKRARRRLPAVHASTSSALDGKERGSGRHVEGSGRAGAHGCRTRSAGGGESADVLAIDGQSSTAAEPNAATMANRVHDVLHDGAKDGRSSDVAGVKRPRRVMITISDDEEDS